MYSVYTKIQPKIRVTGENLRNFSQNCQNDENSTPESTFSYRLQYWMPVFFRKGGNSPMSHVVIFVVIYVVLTYDVLFRALGFYNFVKISVLKLKSLKIKKNAAKLIFLKK